MTWINQLVRDTLTNRFFNTKTIKENINSVEVKVALGNIPSIKAARNFLGMYGTDRMKPDK